MGSVLSRPTSPLGDQELISAGELGNFGVLAVQEHKLQDQEKCDRARKSMAKSGMLAFMPCCTTTNKGGASSGVGFVWPKHVHTQNPGILFGDTNKASIEVDVPGFGFVMCVSYYGKASRPADTVMEVTHILGILKNRKMPYVLMGDFNVDVEEMMESAAMWGKHIHILEGGKSCFPGGNIEVEATTLDYAFISEELDKISFRVNTLSTTLATHRPVAFELAIKDAKENRVLALDRQSKPNTKRVVGPMLVLEVKWSIWKAQLAAFCKEYQLENEDRFVGEFVKHKKFKDNSDRMWEAWRQINEQELRANFSVDSEGCLGGKFVIKDTTELEMASGKSTIGTKNPKRASGP